MRGCDEGHGRQSNEPHIRQPALNEFEACQHTSDRSDGINCHSTALKFNTNATWKNGHWKTHRILCYKDLPAPVVLSKQLCGPQAWSLLESVR